MTSIRRYFVFLVFLCSLFGVNAQDQESSYSSDKQHYRRSSICLVMLTHKDKKYAEGMERVFRQIELPARFNDHQIENVRVISVYGKQSKSDIDNLVKKHQVAQNMVSRWFNRDATTGIMNMDLIHERGGYGAFYDDYERTIKTVRGVDMLKDEGIELLQSTFVLVCDMDYIDQSKGAKWGAIGLGLLSLGLQVGAQVEASQARQQRAQGNYSAARRSEQAALGMSVGSMVGTVGTAVVADIGGFRVKMKAYLYQLNWDDAMTQKMFNEYWVDETTDATTARNNKIKYENDYNQFTLNYVGNYSATSTKTILRSFKNEDEVILDVCGRCLDKGVKKLIEKFDIFKPRAPYYFSGTDMYAHIGRKEDVTYGKKYEVVQPYRDKDGQYGYKKVSTVTASSPWNNSQLRFDEYFDKDEKGTKFYYTDSEKVQTPGLQLREL